MMKYLFKFLKNSNVEFYVGYKDNGDIRIPGSLGCYLLYEIIFQHSHVKRKPTFWVCDPGRLKPACAATEARYRLEILDIETRGIILSRRRTTKMLIRLRGCEADLRLCC